MPRKGRILLASVLMLSLVTPVQAATPKAGAKCSKAGATSTSDGKKYTCIKSGKKLVWNKGVPAKIASTPSPKPTVTPIATPTATQTSEPLTDKEIAYNNIVSYYNASPIPMYEVIKVVHPSVTQDSVDRILTRYENAVKFWRDGFAVKKISLIVGNNDQVLWIKEKLELATNYKFEDWYRNFSAGLPQRRCSTYNAGSYGLDKNGYFLQSFTLYPADCATEEPQDGNYRTTIEHELTHAAQSAITGNRIQLFPCWFKEGQAAYYGSVLGNTNSYASMKSSLSFQTRFSRNVDPKQRLKQLDETYDNFACGQDGGYALGALAVQELVIKHSHTRILDFMVKTASTKNWRSSFDEIFGENFEAFVDNLDNQSLVTNL